MRRQERPDAGGSTADSPRSAIGWLLIRGNRLLIASLFLAATFLSLLALALLGVIDVADQGAVRGVAGGFVPGLIAFLSIVLAINQLVLSQEFGTAGEIRQRIETVREYRRDVEEMADAGPSPVLPTGFLSFVVRTIEAEAAALGESVGSEVEPDAREDVRGYARNVAAEARSATESLERARPGRINALLPVLEYDDSGQLYRARRLRREHESALPEATQRDLERLIETLELFSVARAQFRTTYTQRVLARLSRRLLYVGVPALVVVVVLGLLRTSPPVAGPVRLVTVSAAFSVALSPLAVLSAYLLRVSAVSERTISAGPFVSRPGAAGSERPARSGARAAEHSGSGGPSDDEPRPRADTGDDSRGRRGN